jgi:hypothetical protein
LVTIDTLAQFRKLSNGRGQVYADDYAAIAGLQKLAQKYDIGIIIVHHDRKAEADDVFDTISGSLGLSAAADTLLIMKRQSGAVTLHVRGRDIEEAEMALQFSKETCRWSIIGTAADVHRSNERTAIIRALEAAGDDGLAVAEIMAATESRSRNATDILLFKMNEAGEITRLKRGVYASRKDTGKMGKKERNGGQTTENNTENSNLSDLSDLSATINLSGRAPPNVTAKPAPIGAPTDDLDIPDYLKRPPPQLGQPAISSGPDDNLGDLQ